ncbi:T9SS type A sorting domain-containing protein [Flavobacterium sp. 25HG05S-40]|uniref:T9SS type A sorting domain-containing protein n=1 Tax=Flavobacterium sp. 25HG05S-40 TaxID=3458682 RepID=UPI00404492CC
MKKSLLGRFLQFVFLLTALLFANKNFAQPGGYALRLESNSNFGTAYVLTNNSPTTGILSTTVTAASTADEYLVEWDSFANKWSNTSTAKDTQLQLTWGGGSFNGPNGILNGNFISGKRYTLQMRGLAYSNRQGLFMETDNSPQSFHATASTAVSTPTNVCSGSSVTINVTLAGAKSPQERVFIRYAVNGNFGSSKVVEATGIGSTWTTASATIPGVDNAAGTTINYYAYTTTVAATNSSDHDLVTLRFGNNGGSNYSYNVLTSVTYYADVDGDGFGDATSPVSSCTGAPTVSGNPAVLNNTDCNDTVTYYTDSDGDGFGVLPKLACGSVTNNTDCNDSQNQYTDADGDGFGVLPLVACGVTNNADCNDDQLQYLDADGDGFGSTTQVACGVANNSDCDDAQLQYTDNDSDGFGVLPLVACGVTNNADCNDDQLQYLDADGDGFGSTTQVACGVANNSDCDDAQLQYTDNDSDGFGVLPLVACGVTNNADCNDNQLQYLDADGDGFGSTTQVACGVANNTDCDDAQLQYTDNDSDGFGVLPLVACGVTNNADCNDNQLQYLDADGDGFGSTTQVACGVANNADCDDAQLQYTDNDSDGFGVLPLVACGVTNNADCNDDQLQYLDADGDGFGSTTQVACGVANNTDCDDAQLQYTDNDSDGFGVLPLVACGVTNNADCNDDQLQYLDADGDGFGSTTQVACGVANNTDCDDAQLQYTDNDSDGFGVLPLVACGVTNNADCNDNQLQYLDADGDGFGSTTQVACGVANNSDCDDAQLQYTDNDSDGFGVLPLVACGVANNADCNDNQLQYLDADGDGFGSTTQVACGIANNSDCDDSNSSIWQSGTFYADVDGDNYSPTPTTTQTICYGATEPIGFSLVVNLQVDCNDANDDIYPGAPEVCWNGVLENCTGVLSQGCAAVPVNMTPSYSNTTLVSLATAVPAVAYSFGGFTNIKYRFSITNTTTGVTAPDIIQISRYVTIPGAIHTHGASYTITASAVINEEIVPFAGNTITVNSPSVPVITLSSSSCGATLATLASSLTANPGLNATGYTFRIRLNDSNPSPTYGFSPSATRFVGANTFTGFPLQYGSSYRVAVQYTFTDPVSGLPVDSGYGAECVVNTPSIPVTSMASPSCGGTVSALNANMAARAASYATGYRFRIRLFSDNGPTPTYYQTAVLPSRFSSLTAFQGITIAYSTEYAISVQYSVLNGATTEWSAFGPDCKVTTPFFPTTSLVPSQCGLLTPTSLTQQLNITPYPGFPNYKVLLEEIDGETVVTSEEREIVYSNFKLSDFAIAQLGKNYNISVAIKLNGVFGDYSTACDVFTAAESKALIQTPFAATAYPNPFANNFMLDVKTSSQSSVSVKVYDMVGRLIEQKEVSVSDMESTTIGNQYPSGVYNVVVAQEDTIQTVRVVKR